MILAARWLALLAMLPVVLFPATAGGPVICIGGESDPHFAVEWESCWDVPACATECDAPLKAAAPCEPDCCDCVDFAFGSLEDLRVVLTPRVEPIPPAALAIARIPEPETATPALLPRPLAGRLAAADAPLVLRV